MVHPGRTAVADLVLKPAVEPGVGTIKGLVLGVGSTGTGNPIQGALVEVVMDDQWRPPPPPDPIPLPPGLDLPGATIIAPGQGAAGGMPSVDPPEIIWRVFTTLTGSDGSYSLNVPTGHGMVGVRAWGYHPERKPVTVEKDRTTEMNFRLSNMIRPGPPVPATP